MGRAFEYRKARKMKRWSSMAKIFTRISKDIIMAVKESGPSPDANSRLKALMQNARDANMPKDTVQRAIQKGVGGLDGVNYEEIRYEGYGIGGAAVIVDTLTDNRVRTVAEVRHAFSKYGGNLGTDGSVAFMFKHCGQFLFAPGTSEDQVMDAALEAGAEDVSSDDEGGLEVLCAPADFSQVKAALEKAGLKAEVAEITMKPLNETVLTGEDAARMQKLLDMIEGLDDVQEVHTSAVIDA